MLDIFQSNFRDSDLFFNSNFKNYCLNLSQNLFVFNNNKDGSEKKLYIKDNNKIKKSSKSINLELKRSDEDLNLNLKENILENLNENNFQEKENYLQQIKFKENNLKKKNNFDFDKFNQENCILSDKYWARMRNCK